MKVSPERVVQLLRKPNGLEALANLTGNFVINGQRELWGDGDLAIQVAQSSLAIVGVITKERSWLSEDGDDIFTDITVRPEKVLKGSAQGLGRIYDFGGPYQFANGNTAQQTTIEWRELQVGTKHLLLLKHAPQFPTGLVPTNGIESMFRLSAQGGAPEPFAALDHNPHQVNDNVKGMTGDGLIAAVQSLALRKAPPQ